MLIRDEFVPKHKRSVRVSQQYHPGLAQPHNVVTTTQAHLFTKRSPDPALVYVFGAYFSWKECREGGGGEGRRGGEGIEEERGRRGEGKEEKEGREGGGKERGGREEERGEE